MRTHTRRVTSLITALAMSLALLAAGPAPATAAGDLVADTPDDAPARADVLGLYANNGQNVATFTVSFEDFRRARIDSLELLLDTGRRYGTGWLLRVTRLAREQGPRVRFGRITVATESEVDRVSCPGLAVRLPGSGAPADTVRIRIPQSCMADDAAKFRLLFNAQASGAQDSVPDGDFSSAIARG